MLYTFILFSTMKIFVKNLPYQQKLVVLRNTEKFSTSGRRHFQTNMVDVLLIGDVIPREQIRAFGTKLLTNRRARNIRAPARNPQPRFGCHFAEGFPRCCRERKTEDFCWFSSLKWVKMEGEGECLESLKSQVHCAARDGRAISLFAMLADRSVMKSQVWKLTFLGFCLTSQFLDSLGHGMGDPARRTVSC